MSYDLGGGNLREESVEDPLSSQQGVVPCQLLSDRSQLTDRPHL